MTTQADSSRAPLWRWVSARVIALVLVTAATVAFSMWLRYALWNSWIMHQMPDAARLEFQELRADPHGDKHRLRQLIDEYYGIESGYPEILDTDWLVLGLLLLCAMPLITLAGLRISRPISKQFSHVARAAKQVAQGDFSTRAPIIAAAPQELKELALDFNEMTSKLQRYELEIRESSAILAHELRTPLNAAMGRVQGMIDSVFPAGPDQLAMVLGQLDHLNGLVRDLHLISLIHAGQMVLEKDRFPLKDLIDERLSWGDRQIEQSAILVTRKIDATLAIEADRNRLGQVFSILIDNAERYAGDGRQLDISASLADDVIIIEFSDRGPGIPPEHLAQMFDRFWRAEHSRARHSGGSGLGLSIASAICGAHGGTISALNRDGGGVTIRIKLPVS